MVKVDLKLPKRDFGDKEGIKQDKTENDLKNGDNQPTQLK